MLCARGFAPEAERWAALVPIRHRKAVSAVAIGTWPTGSGEI